MNNELLLSITKNTDTLIEQTKSRPHETLEFKLNKQMKTFSFSPPRNLVEEEKMLLSATYCEATKPAFNITDENNSFQLVHLVFGEFLIIHSIELLID